MLQPKYVCNAFSIQMLAPSVARNCSVNFEEVSEEDAKEAMKWTESAVGHADTATALGVECQRISVELFKGDSIIVAQLVGGRLPEGSTTLPAGFKFRYYMVNIN